MTFDKIMDCYEENMYYWKMLLEYYEQNRIIPFVGAGCSVPTYSLWGEALENILGDTGEGEQTVLHHYLGLGQYEEACDYVCNRLGLNTFFSRVEREFSFHKIKDKGISELLGTLIQVFNGTVITTNFEKSIEEAYRGTSPFKDVYLLSNMKSSYAVITDVIRENRHCLLKIHGDINDNNSLVFRKQEYDDKYDYKAFTTALERLFQSQAFLFLGCSLNGNDRYVNLIKNIVEKENDNAAPIKNFAFLSLPKRAGMDDREYRQCMNRRINQLNSRGIFPIWYPEERHESVPILLKMLHSKQDVKKK